MLQYIHRSRFSFLVLLVFFFILQKTYFYLFKSDLNCIYFNIYKPSFSPFNSPNLDNHMPRTIHYGRIPSHDDTVDETFKFIDQDIPFQRISRKEKNCKHTKIPSKAPSPPKFSPKQEPQRRQNHSSEYVLPPYHILVSGLKQEFFKPLEHYINQFKVNIYIEPLIQTKEVINYNSVMILQVKNQTRFDYVEQNVMEFIQQIRKENPDVLVLKLGCHFHFRHSYQLQNALAIINAISQEDEVVIDGKTLRFPSNMILAIAYRILFYKLGFKINFSNPQKKDKVDQKAQLKEILKRKRNFLEYGSYKYKKYDGNKSVYSSQYPDLIGVQSFICMKFAKSERKLQIFFKSCLDCSDQVIP